MGGRDGPAHPLSPRPGQIYLRCTTEPDEPVLPFDYLVVALGADLDSDAVPGFVESGGHDFYSMEGARALAPVLRGFEAGILVLGIFRPPYKCPPAPYEVACQVTPYPYLLVSVPARRYGITTNLSIASVAYDCRDGVAEVPGRDSEGRA